MLCGKSRWLMLLIGVVSVPAWAETIIPGGLIDTKAVGTVEGSPPLIDGHVLLAADMPLQIEPRVDIPFHGNNGPTNVRRHDPATAGGARRLGSLPPYGGR